MCDFKLSTLVDNTDNIFDRVGVSRVRFSVQI